MSTKIDDKFVTTAADPASRRTAISDLTKKRTILSWLCAIILLGFFGICIFGSRQPDALFIFVVIFSMMQFNKCESDLRLLRVIEKLTIPPR